MLTGLGIAPSANAARNAGIRRIITKPVSGRLLKITLAEELGHLRRIQHSHPRNTPLSLSSKSDKPILVAEDHPLSQKVIKGMLSRLGLDCDTVDNGVDALRAAQSGHYQLILMDCDMPGMDGFTATRHIRDWEQDTGRKPLPIIALTAHIMDEHRERSLESGMNAHLSKPIELGELRDALSAWLDTERPQQDQDAQRTRA
jgi:CheY-like chemotaxis protein